MATSPSNTGPKPAPHQDARPAQAPARPTTTSDAAQDPVEQAQSSPARGAGSPSGTPSRPATPRLHRSTVANQVPDARLYRRGAQRYSSLRHRSQPFERTGPQDRPVRSAARQRRSVPSASSMQNRRSLRARVRRGSAGPRKSDHVFITRVESYLRRQEMLILLYAPYRLPPPAPQESASTGTGSPPHNLAANASPSRSLNRRGATKVAPVGP